MSIRIAEDNFTGELQIITDKWSLDNCNFELIEDAGEFISDDGAVWATEVNGDRYTGPGLFIKGRPTEQPRWATHVLWFDD